MHCQPLQTLWLKWRHSISLTSSPSVEPGIRFFGYLVGEPYELDRPFELSALKFTHDGVNFFFRAKAGRLSASSIRSEYGRFDPIGSLPEEGNAKVIDGDQSAIERIFKSGAYAFFPSSRFEIPYWANVQVLERNPEWDFTQPFSDRLEKPIVVQSALQEIKPWLLDVFAEQLVELTTILQATDLAQLQSSVVQRRGAALFNTLGLNEILSKILGRPARAARLPGAIGDRRLCIASENEIILPSIDHLSAGQSSLLSIFGTIAKYGNVPRAQLNQIQGIVLVDEIDNHLHAELQHTVLPQLMKLFPRVRLIVTFPRPPFSIGNAKNVRRGWVLTDRSTFRHHYRSGSDFPNSKRLSNTFVRRNLLRMQFKTSSDLHMRPWY